MVTPLRIAFVLLTLIVGALALKREPIAMAYFASQTVKSTLAEREALLDEHIEIRAPDGEGPFPVVIQLHGCAGIRTPFQHQWADIANAAGYAAMIVDSNGARGLDRATSLELVCGGKRLLGQERAGDIAAAIEIAQRDPRLDAERIVVAGWSHGAWTAMDYLTMDMRATAPAGLDPSGFDAPEISGAILFYPYCGVGALSRFRAPAQQPQTLALIAGEDEVVDERQCVRYFDRQKRAGAPLEMVVYEGANHVFDDPFLEPEYLHWYNEEYFKDAAARYADFLERLN